MLHERWFSITRDLLPSVARDHGWPISADHCFMRVCLDNSLGAAWPSLIGAPAYLNLSDDQLSAAIAVAESVIAAPQTLPVLNQRSLAMRKSWRAKGSPKVR